MRISLRCLCGVFSSPQPNTLALSVVHTFEQIYLQDQLAYLEFHTYHHWDGELAVLSFGASLVKTLVSTATKKSHRDIMVKSVDDSEFIFD